MAKLASIACFSECPQVQCGRSGHWAQKRSEDQMGTIRVQLMDPWNQALRLDFDLK